MDLRHLRYFVVVAEELNFTRAALRLNIGQPPLSKQIRDLERELGAPLFHRLDHRIKLTEVGRFFFQDAKSILQHASHLIATVQGVARGEQGVLRVGFTTTASFNRFVTSVINLHRETYHDVQLILREDSSSALIRDLKTGIIDVAFLRTTDDESKNLRIELLFNEKMLVALPQSHRLAGRSSLPLRALMKESFIMSPRADGSALYDVIFDACRAAGFVPQIGQEAPKIGSTMTFVATGTGIAIVPESLRHLHPDGVVYKPIDGTVPVAPMAVSCQRGNTSVVVDRFMALAMRAAREKAGSSTRASTKKASSSRLVNPAVLRQEKKRTAPSRRTVTG
jgi:DNA-binding transcriptional LysR family regulator